MKLNSKEKLILANALGDFIRKAWDDFAIAANNPNVLQSEKIKMQQHNTMLGEIMVKLLGKLRAEKFIRGMIDDLENEEKENGDDTGRQSKEAGENVPS